MVDDDDDDTIDENEPIDEAAAEPQTEIPPEVAVTVRNVTTAFAANVPPAASASGSYDMAVARDMAQDHAAEAAMLPLPVVPKATGVPDGRYRVEGSDWIVTFAGELAVLFERGGPQSDPASYTTVRAT